MGAVQIPARTRRVFTTVRAVNPLAAALAARMRTLIGTDLNGSRGTIRIGERYGQKYSGYGNSPQNFRGMASAGAAPSGAIRAGLGSGLPGTQAPYSETSPLLALIASTQNPPQGGKQ